MHNIRGVFLISILLLSTLSLIPISDLRSPVPKISSKEIIISDLISVKLELPDFEYEIYKYHNSTELFELTQRLAEEYGLTLEVIGYSWKGKPIYALEITNGNSEGKPYFLIVGLHHGREWITAEAAFYIAAYFASKYGKDPDVTEILNNINLIVIPVLNPDGLDIALYKNEWQRKNAREVDEDYDGLSDEDPPEDINGDGYIELRYISHMSPPECEGVDNDMDGHSGEDWEGGVDLNRNYPYAWGEVYGLQWPWTEVYQGPEPLSEPEVRAIVTYMSSKKPIVAISLHSGIEALLYPWGYWSGEENFEANLYKALLQKISEVTKWEYGVASELYPASGVWDDWAFGDLHCLAFTAEIYGNNEWPKRRYEERDNTTIIVYYGIKWMFNPNITEERTEFERVLANTLAMVRITSFFTINMLSDKSPPEVILPNELAGYLEKDSIKLRRTMIDFNITVRDNESGILYAGIVLTKNNTVYKVFDGHIPLYLNGWKLNISTENISEGDYLIYLNVTNRAGKSLMVRLGSLNVTTDGEVIIDWDLDNDHLSDAAEILNGADPDNPDTDGDGISDGEEFLKGGWEEVIRKPVRGIPPYVVYLAIIVAVAVVMLIVIIWRIKKRTRVT